MQQLTSQTHAALPWLAAATTVVLWASAFVAIRSTVDTFTAGGLTLVRTATASLALTVFVLLRWQFAGRPVVSPPLRTLGIIAVWGLSWFGLYSYVLNLAATRLDAGTMALVVNVAPILIVVLAGVFLREGFPRRIIAGAAISLAGVAIIAGGNAMAGVTLIGVVLALLAAVIYATASLVQKVIGQSVDALTMVWIGCLAGFAGSLVFTPELLATPLSPDALGGAVYLGVFPTAIAFVTWGYALRSLPAGRVAMSTFVVPPLTVVMGWLILSEVPPVASLVGGALCLMGVAVALVRRRTAQRRPAGGADAGKRPIITEPAPC